jgi:hypothetical protein
MMDLSGLRQANDTMGTAPASRWIFAGALQRSTSGAEGGGGGSSGGAGLRLWPHFLARDSIVLLGLGLAVSSWLLLPGGRRRPIWAGAGAIY